MTNSKPYSDNSALARAMQAYQKAVNFKMPETVPKPPDNPAPSAYEARRAERLRRGPMPTHAAFRVHR